ADGLRDRAKHQRDRGHVRGIGRSELLRLVIVQQLARHAHMESGELAIATRERLLELLEIVCGTLANDGVLDRRRQTHARVDEARENPIRGGAVNRGRSSWSITARSSQKEAAEQYKPSRIQSGKE